MTLSRELGKSGADPTDREAESGCPKRITAFEKALIPRMFGLATAEDICAINKE